MLTIDWILLAALAVATAYWWMTSVQLRRPVVAIASLAALAVGVLAILSYRWQAVVGVSVSALLLFAVLISKLRAGGKPLRTPLVSGSLFTLLAIAAFIALYVFPVPNLPKPSGEHPVGVRDFDLTDTSRRGVFAAQPGEARRLLARVWYPAEQVEGLSPRPYFSDREAETTARGLGTAISLPFFFQYLAHASTNSFENAPLLADAANQPTVIYSHGYTSFAGQNTALMEALASRGYLVYSIQHTYDSSAVVFSDGEVADMDPDLIKTMREMAEAMTTSSEAMGNQIQAFVAPSFDARREATQASYAQAIATGQRIASQSADVWRADRIFVHDQLESGLVPESVAEIVAASDLSRTGQMGMSFGGSTTGGVCMVDSRCAAAVNLDGGDYHFTPFHRTMPVPFLMIYSDFDKIAAQVSGDPNAVGHGFNDFSYERHETAGLRPDIYRLMVRDLAHLGLSDLPLFMRLPVDNPLFGSIDPDRIIQIQNDFVRGFFDKHLRGVQNGFPTEQFEQHAEHVMPDHIDDLREWWLAANPINRTLQVVLETPLGEIEIALYPERAPVSTAQFLAYVDAGHFDGASFYRATSASEGHIIDVVQGGLHGATMRQGLDEYAGAESPMPPIAHETTEMTGIANQRGTIAFARMDPGTANSEFFFNLQDNPMLDVGYTGEGRDGHGYATFGRVLRGMRVLEQIQAMPSDAPTPIELVSGQILEQPVEIVRAYRADVPSSN